MLGRWSAGERRGFALVVDEQGAIGLMLGDGARIETIGSGRPLFEREWAFVAACYDAATGRVAIVQELLGRPGVGAPAIQREAMAAVKPSAEGLPLLMAAALQERVGERLATALHYNGKIERPRLARRALTRAEMAQANDQSHGAVLGDALAGAWDFAADISSETVRDLSRNGLQGRTVNLPARAMTGHNWDGSVFGWRQAPEQYGAIHFHEDDLYDAGWDCDFELALPHDLPSGAYAARLRLAGDEDHVPFFVTPKPGQRRADLAFLAATATYVAYANPHYAFDDPIDEVSRGTLTVLRPGDVYLNEHRELGLSTYDSHRDGSGVCHSSRLRPMLNFRPRGRVWNFNADLFVLDWLEAQGIACDVITDDDLHDEGAAALAPYRVVLTGTHPEYFTTPMWDGLASYLDRGGRLMYLGGNGFYWRCAWHPTLPGALELRRAENGTRNWIAEPGEYHHSFDGERGGLWRSLGRAPQRLVGVGFAAEGFDVSSHFRRAPGSFEPRAAFVFDGIGADEVIGDFGALGGGAAGMELDRADRRLGTPPQALVLASSELHSNVYVPTPEELRALYPGLDGIECPTVRADMLFFETPAGGAVWSTGSIAWACSLPHNGFANNVARITGNVLRRFVDPAPFVMPEG